jgi:hypothetical protein
MAVTNIPHTQDMNIAMQLTLNRNQRLSLMAALCLFGWAGSALAAPTLTVGNVTGQAGTSVTVPITFDPTTSAVAGIQFTLTVPTGVSTGTVTAGAIVTNAGKLTSDNLIGNSWNIIVFGLNQTSIASGSLMTLQMPIAGSTGAGNLSLTLSNVVYTDANGQSIPAGTTTGGTLTVTAPPPPPPPPPPATPVISSTGTASGTVGTAFSYQIVATNSPTSYNATGLPGSLTINTTTGRISGTPTAAGNSTITLSATNAGGTGTKTLNLTITAPTPNPPTLTMGSVSGQAGTSVNVPVSFNPNGSAVTGIQFSLTVPAGVSTGTVTPGAIVTSAGKGVSDSLTGNTWTFIVFGLNQTTIASGSLMTLQMPIAASTAAGAKSLALSGVVYTDANGVSIPAGTNTNGTLTVTAAPPPPPQTPVINSAGTATGVVGSTFSYQITATNSPTSFDATGLPAGLTVNTATGRISGTPSAAATSTINLSATNSAGTGTRTLTLTVTLPVNQGVPTMAAGSASGAAGTQVSLPLNFTSNNASVAGIQFNMTLPANLNLVSFSTGTVLTSAGKTISVRAAGNVLTFVIFGLNQTAIANGALMTLNLQISASAQAGVLNLPISAVVYADPSGNTVPSGVNGPGVVTVTTSGSLPLAPPDLSTIPNPIGLSSNIQLGNARSYSNVNFIWTFTPIAASGSSGSGSLGTGALVAPIRTNSAQTASLLSYGLTMGTYQLTVQVVDNNNPARTASASKTISVVMSDFSAVRVYPNPWRSDRHAGTQVTFDHLPIGSTVKLYSVSGHFVAKATLTVDPTMAFWDLKTDKGDSVASGLYLYVITASGSSDKSRGKLVVIR